MYAFASAPSTAEPMRKMPAPCAISWPRITRITPATNTVNGNVTRTSSSFRRSSPTRWSLPQSVDELIVGHDPVLGVEQQDVGAAPGDRAVRGHHLPLELERIADANRRPARTEAVAAGIHEVLV